MITELRFTVVTPPALPGSNQFPVHTGNRNVSSDSDTKQTHNQKTYYEKLNNKKDLPEKNIIIVIMIIKNGHYKKNK